MTGDALQPVTDALVSGRHGTHAPPAAVLALAEGGETHTVASGVADLAGGEAATTGHAQDTASVGKVLTTLTLHVLFAQGLLEPADTLGHVLGGRSGRQRDVTLDDLLRHRAGLAEWWPLYLEPGAREDPVATALRRPPRYPRGEGRHYSDLGMQALGAVVAQATGLPFAEAVRALLLEPLGAGSVTPGRPPAGTATLTGPDGDAIEREMVRSGDPYPVTAPVHGFAWRTHPLRDEIADGNAFHAFQGAAGHAGWFADVDGLMRVAGALAVPERVGIDPATAAGLRTVVDAGQGRGVRHYTLRWRGRDRLFLGHSGFTGAFVAASAATADEPELRVALLANRLHGRPAPGRDRLTGVDTLWRESMTRADAILHPISTGGRP